MAILTSTTTAAPPNRRRAKSAEGSKKEKEAQPGHYYSKEEATTSCLLLVPVLQRHSSCISSFNGDSCSSGTTRTTATKSTASLSDRCKSIGSADFIRAEGEEGEGGSPSQSKSEIETTSALSRLFPSLFQDDRYDNGILIDMLRRGRSHSSSSTVAAASDMNNNINSSHAGGGGGSAGGSDGITDMPVPAFTNDAPNSPISTTCTRGRMRQRTLLQRHYYDGTAPPECEYARSSTRSLGEDDADVAAGTTSNAVAAAAAAAVAAAVASAVPASPRTSKQRVAAAATGSTLPVSGSETDFLLLASQTSVLEEEEEDDEAEEEETERDENGRFGKGTNSDEYNGGVVGAAAFVDGTHERGSTILLTDHHHHHHDAFRVLGINISRLSRKEQFVICASGVFFFSLLYGFLQELLSVTLCNRQLGLFLAMAQFAGYTAWSFLLRRYVHDRRNGNHDNRGGGGTSCTTSCCFRSNGKRERRSRAADGDKIRRRAVPLEFYLGLSFLRAVDLGMTNMAMQYVNYPAKTLMKSSRVVFTMLFGVLVARKRYKLADYVVVILMVSGLVIFMHADAHSSAVFHSYGIVMLTISLLCDGAMSNMSEAIMRQYGVCQDEFIFFLYSIALVAITAAAAVKGDLLEGMRYLSQPGTYEEIEKGLQPTWSISSKIIVMVVFSTTGFFGSSCSAAITKNFGALTMSITSTARKATTLFLSFAFFDNECTFEHVGGIFLFISALIFKSFKHGRGGAVGGGSGKKNSIKTGSRIGPHIEMGGSTVLGGVGVNGDHHQQHSVNGFHSCKASNNGGVDHMV